MHFGQCDSLYRLHTEDHGLEFIILGICMMMNKTTNVCTIIMELIEPGNQPHRYLKTCWTESIIEDFVFDALSHVLCV